jgi:hypothetical protein
MASVATAVLMAINLAMWALVVLDLKPTPGADFWFQMLMTGLPVLGGLCFSRSGFSGAVFMPHL